MDNYDYVVTKYIDKINYSFMYKYPLLQWNISHIFFLQGDVWDRISNFTIHNIIPSIYVRLYLTHRT
jgi:hypothetical protein